MNSNEKLVSILQCPSCKRNELILNSEESKLECKACQSIYTIANNVPIMLQDKADNDKKSSEVHQKQGTTFDYIDHYQKDAEHFDYFQTRTGATEHIERRLREYILHKSASINGATLDVGCGSAWVAKNILPSGNSVISMDISLKNTSKALELYPSENHNAVVADAYLLPFADNSIDRIIASEIIEHTYDPAAFIESLFRVLKPGGELIITTPYKEKINFSLCIHCNKQTPHSAHLHSFDENNLLSLYKKEDLGSCTYSTFGNKLLIHLRTHKILKLLPFGFWKVIDKFSNVIYSAPTVILVKWKKAD